MYSSRAVDANNMKGYIKMRIENDKGSEEERYIPEDMLMAATALSFARMMKGKDNAGAHLVSELYSKSKDIIIPL